MHKNGKIIESWKVKMPKTTLKEVQKITRTSTKERHIGVRDHIHWMTLKMRDRHWSPIRSGK